MTTTKFLRWLWIAVAVQLAGRLLDLRPAAPGAISSADIGGKTKIATLLLGVLAALSISPGAAGATSVRIQVLPEAGGPLAEGDTVLAILGDARRNKVKLRIDPGGLQYVIRDPEGVTPGAGCAAAGPDAAVCESLVDGYVAQMMGANDVFVDQIGSATSGDVVGGQVVGVVSGQGGDDTIIGTTNASEENLFSGGAGDDQIHGGNSADVVVGGPGDDDLSGGKGRDRCLGGKGSDAAQDCEVRRGIP